MKKRATITIFILIFAVIAVAAGMWQFENAKYGRGFDQMASVILTIQAYYELTAGDYTNFFPKGFKEANRHPPLVFFTGAFAMLIFGHSLEVMSLTNLLFYFALIIAVYILGAKRGGAQIGFVAIAFVIAQIAFIKYLLTWNTDMAGAATVAWTMVFLDDQRTTKHWWSMACLGVVMFIGSMSRLTYWLFVGAPVVFVFINHIVPEIKSGQRPYIMKALGKWFFLLVLYRALTALVPLKYHLFDELSKEVDIVGSEYAPFTSLQGVPFYLNWWHEVGPILLLMGTLGIIYTGIFHREKIWLLLIWLMIPLVGFSYFSVNATRLLLPAWPAMAVFAAMLFIKLGSRAKTALACVMVLASLGFFIVKAQDSLISKPPEYGAGWEKYSARDIEIVEKIQDITGAVVFIDTNKTRLFSHSMLHGQIVLDNPDRKFFRISFEEYLEMQIDTLRNTKVNLNDISAIIIREPAKSSKIWDKNYWVDFWSAYRMNSPTNSLTLETVEILDKIIGLLDNAKESFKGTYFYDGEEFRIRIFLL